MVAFNPDQDIPDLSGRVIIVTGGTDGLGKETVLRLSKHKAAHIYLAARSKSKSEIAIAEIKSKSPSACPITFLELDLSSFESIKSAASTFLATESRLDILIANAGIIGTKGTTKEGYEMTFGVNHVGHALLINLLLPLMQKTAKEQATGNVRIVIVGSEAEKFAPKNYYLLKPDEVKSNLGSYSTMSKYGHSKIANIHYTKALAKRYPEEEYKVKIVCIHPGAVITNLGHDMMPNWPRVTSLLRKVIAVVLSMVTVEEGAKGQLWAATAPGAVHGEFYWPVGLLGKGSYRVSDEKKAEELWQWTEGELKAHA